MHTEIIDPLVSINGIKDVSVTNFSPFTLTWPFVVAYLRNCSTTSIAAPHLSPITSQQVY